MTRKGFTLTEVLLATTLFSLMAVAIFSASIGGQRLLKLTLARGELALRSRELREKLLFHAAPNYGGTVWAGLLTGTNATASIVQSNGSKLLLHATGLKGSSAFSGDSVPQTIELSQVTDTDGNRRLDSADTHDATWVTRWLCPGNLNLFAGNDAAFPVFDATDLNEDKRLYVNVRGRITVGGVTVAHDERIVVPIFGAIQTTETNNGGGLCD